MKVSSKSIYAYWDSFFVVVVFFILGTLNKNKNDVGTKTKIEEKKEERLVKI